jgi:hypothetical protein
MYILPQYFKKCILIRIFYFRQLLLVSLSLSLFGGVWSQGLHLEPLHQPFFVNFFFFCKIGSHELFAWGWLQTTILLISASWVGRITGVSLQHLVIAYLLKTKSFPNLGFIYIWFIFKLIFKWQKEKYLLCLRLYKA